MMDSENKIPKLGNKIFPVREQNIPNLGIFTGKPSPIKAGVFDMYNP